MMWISRDHLEFDDVRDTVKEVFKTHGIAAVRADEIEYEAMITDRIIQEIASSEFLLADLTGERRACARAARGGRRPGRSRASSQEVVVDETDEVEAIGPTRAFGKGLRTRARYALARSMQTTLTR
jgi:hypothetical protein